MLWIALFLPTLSQQLARRGSREPLALGVQADISTSTQDAETQAVHNLACWAGQFTPNVAAEKAGLLLEVSGTLRLHQGVPRLLTRLRHDMAELGYEASPGVAPTPLAAWWLAKARQAGLAVRMCRDKTLLPERLAPLPLTLLEWPDELQQTLQALGIRTLGQCLDLPRDAFVRRFGHAVRCELDKALGLLADPRPWFSPPEHFSNRVEFNFELDNALALLFPLKRMLTELEGFLRARGAGVQEWYLQLEHRRCAPTRLAIGTLSPERSAEALLALARERLAQLKLEAPVLSLGISTEHLLPFAENSQNLVANPHSQALGWHQLVDRLSARLGHERLYHLRALDDYRPERAWQRCAVGQSPARSPTPATLTAPRPLWLLDPPRQLSSRDGQPLCHGQLHMLAGPERIETGWWDEHSMRRDYYVARNPRGETLWIFREHRRAAPWYLHGIFA